MKEYQATIGLEIHVQLKTKSKMFCRDSAAYFGAVPNSHTCPVCLGLPGALPVINEEAIKSAIKFGLALNCSIGKVSKFDRKNYFYPDLPKGYQISQFDLPIAQKGLVEVGGKKIRVNRAHMEEDTGKLIHSKIEGKTVSLIDFNRSGVPLMEIVSEPDIDSPEEAKKYAKRIHQIARYLEVADVDMEKAGMRFDANVSVRRRGEKELGTKVEIKNINSFRFLEKALAYEIERQTGLLENKELIVQETRGWVESRSETVPQRTKETSPDYRYFPEPDLPPLEFEEKEVKKLKDGLGELPGQKETRFADYYGLDKKTVQTLTEDKYTAQWYEKALSIYTKGDKDIKEKAKALANWVAGEINRKLKEQSLSIKEIPIEPASLVELLILIEKGRINQNTGKKVLDSMFETGLMPAKIIEEGGLAQISSQVELSEIVEKIVKENKKAASDFKEGKEASLGFLIGQAMKQTKGKANPKLLNQMIRDKLER